MKTGTAVLCGSVAALFTPANAQTRDPGSLPCSFSGYVDSFTLGLPGEPADYYSIASDGDQAVFAYARDGAVPFAGMVILDITDPAAPGFAGTIQLDDLRSLAMDDGIVYAEVDSTPPVLKIYDISDPSNPADLGEIPLQSSLADVELGDNRLYLLGLSSVDVFDVSDPSKPIHLITLTPDAGVSGIAARGDQLFLLRNDAVLDVYELAQDVEPVGSTPVDCPANFRARLAVEGDRLIIADQATLAMVDVTDGSMPRALGCVRAADLPLDARRFSIDDVALHAGMVYLFDNEQNLIRVDWSDDAEPKLTGVQDTPGYGIGFAFSGSTGLVADGPGGIAIVDTDRLNIVDPVIGVWSPTFGGELVHHAESVIEDGILYQIAYNGLDDRFEIIAVDVSDPSTPELLSAYSGDWDSIGDLEVRDGMVYAATGSTGLDMIDFRNPRQPALFLRFSPIEYVEALSIDGGRLAIEGGGPVIVLDIADPWIPSLESIVLPQVHSNTRSMALAGSTLLVAGENDAGDALVEVIDFSDPTRPISTVTPTPAQYVRIKADDGVLYAIANSGARGLYASAIGDLDRASYYPVDDLENITVSDGVVFLFGDAGLLMLDAADPYRTPTLIASKGTFNRGVAVENNTAYISDDQIQIIDVTRSCSGCPADFNNDGVVTFFDVSAFIAGFNVGDAAADFDANGQINFLDVAAFLLAFSAGCP